MNINQTTPAKPNRKERRALERKIRKETKNQMIAVPTNENGVLAVYVPVSEQPQPKETTPIQPLVKPPQTFLSDATITQLMSTQFSLEKAKQAICEHKESLQTYSMFIEALMKIYENELQQQMAKAETAVNLYHAANVIAVELGFPKESNSLDVDIKASQRNVEESKTYLQALLDEYKCRVERLISSINKLNKAIFSNSTTPWIVSDEAIERFMRTEQKRLADLLVEKENRRAEAARQAEIDSLLARLKELGYDPAETKSKPNENEFFVTVERREEVVPIISITLNGEPLTMSVDEAIAEIKRWRANLPKKSSKDNPLDNQDNIDHLRLIEKLSFVKQIDRTSLFKYDFDWSYNTFWYRFKGLVSKYNIKLWCRYKMTFDR